MIFNYYQTTFNWTDHNKLVLISFTNGQVSLNVYESANIPFAGDHTHLVSGNTASAGSSDATYGDTRPYSYGVNWIIKI